jgi:hypothetical protein
MINRIKNFLFRQRTNHLIYESTTIHQQLLIYHYQNESNQRENSRLYDYGFSVFSQHEEDGILLYIFSKIGTTNKLCVELCVGNGIESNSANLIINHFWHGLLLDGNEQNVNTAINFFSSHKNCNIFPPKIFKEWIEKDNVNRLIENHGFTGEIDLFVLDIDGNDYYILKELDVVSPRVIVVEINHLWGWEKAVTIPYQKDFVAEFTTDGTDYAGASLAAFIKICHAKGYRFVGTNRFATNAFFIRNDILHPDLCEEINVAKYFTHKRVIYGMTERFNKIKNKDWIYV